MPSGASQFVQFRLHVGKVEDVVKVGDKLRVEIADIDNRGKISLIMVAEELATYRSVYLDVNGTPAPPPVLAGWTYCDENPERARVMAERYIGGYWRTVVDHYEIVGSHLQVDSIIEIKKTGKTSGEIVWAWHLWDHLVQDHDQAKPNFGKVAEHPELVDLNYTGEDLVGGILANDSRPAEFLYDNLAIELNVIEAARRSGAERIVMLGSSCIYPRLAPQPLREDSLLSGPLEIASGLIAFLLPGEASAVEIARQFGIDL